MIRNILFLILCIFAFAAGVVYSAKKDIGAPFVSVEFSNKTGRVISSIEMHHNMGQFGQITHGVASIPAYGTRQIRIWAPAESGYKLIITFADEKRLSGGIGHIRPGDQVTESIEDDQVRSTVKPPGGYGLYRFVERPE